jgi:hypothetical protein
MTNTPDFYKKNCKLHTNKYMLSNVYWPKISVETWQEQKQEGEWKRISRKQSARWQHLSRLKAITFLSLKIFLVVKKCNYLNLGLVMPSGR